MRRRINPDSTRRFQLGREHGPPGRVAPLNKEKTMTYVEPTPPGGPSPEIEPGATPGPEVDPGDTPSEMPPLEPGGGGEGDSRPHD